MSQILASTPYLETLSSLSSPTAIVNSGFLTHFTHMRNVTIHYGCQANDLQTLAQLPNLRRLDLNMTMPCSSVIISPSLTHLFVRGVWNYMSGPLEGAQVPQLRSLSMETGIDDTQLTAETSRLLHVVAGHSRLEELYIEIGTDDYDDPEPDLNLRLPEDHNVRRLASTIEPLLSLRALRQVSLHFYSVQLGYTSVDVQAFSDAWPYLEELRLNFVDARGPRPRLDTLADFVQNHPRLRVLELPGMDVVEGSFTAGAGAPMAPHTHICELIIPRVVFLGTDEARLSAEMWQFIERQFPRAARHAIVGDPGRRPTHAS